jgi:hypothetical protein
MPAIGTRPGKIKGVKIQRQELLISEYFLLLLFEAGLTPADVAKNILDLNPKPYAVLSSLLEKGPRSPKDTVTLDKGARATLTRMQDTHRLSQRLGAPLAPILKPLLEQELGKGVCKKMRSRHVLLDLAIALNAGNGIVDAIAVVSDATHLNEKIETQFYSADRTLRAIDSLASFLPEPSLALPFELIKFGLAYSINLVDFCRVLAGRQAI